jgi:hypothetical protein
MLIAQAETRGPDNRLSVAILSARQNGKLVMENSVDLPASVKVSADAPKSKFFKLDARIEHGDPTVSWEYLDGPVKGAPPGELERLPGETDPMGKSRPEAHYLRGRFRVDLLSGAITKQPDGGPAPAFVRKAPQLPEAARLPGVSGKQFLSADGRHVLSSEPNPADPSWERFVWTVYDRNTGQRVGQLKAHASYAPFFVDDRRIVYVTGPYSRRTASGMQDEPHQLRAVDLQNGNRVWSQPVRDMQDPQGPPP